ncbi:Deoxyribodipyrimidine photo-lyase [Orchesella cincta]|uniref:Deoxyribodipyrimidine photo-lyase n=1 Tax=Orchesella cincta TaxID=48709 RepID=A0A1D2NCF6_ORCCI|nr:Deoxyribodipyrimidine photo-lyase [Orchesella cincta]
MAGKSKAPEKKASSSSSKGTAKEDDAPAEKKKKEVEDFDGFNARIREQRKSEGSSQTFKFDKSRCRMITEDENLPASHSGVLYWMSRDQRVQDNWALIYAQRLALKEKVPLFVCFCLVPKFLQATLRQYAFMLKGLRSVQKELVDLNIPFSLLFGEAKAVLPDFVKKHKIGGVVTDFSPLRTPRAWVDEVAKKLPEDVPLCQVDAHNIVPVWVTSEKLEYAARTIRPKIHKHLPDYLTEFPDVISHPHKSSSKFENPFKNWDELMAFLKIDKTVGEVEWAKPGTAEAFQTLRSCDVSKLDFRSAGQRDDPDSGLTAVLEA